jgi:hypothetical protein
MDSIKGKVGLAPQASEQYGTRRIAAHGEIKLSVVTPSRKLLADLLDTLQRYMP